MIFFKLFRHCKTYYFSWVLLTSPRISQIEAVAMQLANSGGGSLGAWEAARAVGKKGADEEGTAV